MSERLATFAAGLVIDRLIGDPDALWRRVPHPVAWIGWAISVLDERWNRESLPFRTRRRNGIAAIALILAGALAAGAALHALLQLFGPAAWLAEGAVVAVFLAHKSLKDHVARVALALRTEGLEGGRAAVSQIVGRDVTVLDEAGICRAAMESLAENASDGVLAPALWYVLAGLPGLLAYKAVNTADSMIGHMSERHRAFGWAAARLDDLVNWPAARLCALAIALAGSGLKPSRLRALLAATRRDAPSHRSPNAGWPETAMAAALGIALGGPRRYGELLVEAPLLNREGRRQLTPDDLDRGLTLFDRAMALFAVLAACALLAAECLG